MSKNLYMLFYSLNINRLIFRFNFIYIHIYIYSLILEEKIIASPLFQTISVCLGQVENLSFFEISAYFCYYLWVLHFLVLFMSFTVLFN